MNMHSADATTAEEALAIQRLTAIWRQKSPCKTRCLPRVFTPLILTNWTQLCVAHS